MSMSIDTTVREDQSTRGLKVMTTASTPATPGPATPIAVRSLPLDRTEDNKENIAPPARPSSTPFPEQELKELAGLDTQCSTLALARRVDLQSLYAGNLGDPESSVPSNEAPSASSALCKLPVEIHECILDHLFGMRLSASAITRTSSSGQSKILRGWSTALRHCRRRDVWELALVTKDWRDLIQDRLYRHIKIKGTRRSIDLATIWFEEHPHLARYVKHIEFWFPVFQPKLPIGLSLRAVTTGPGASAPTPILLAEPLKYQAPTSNCTLEEAFRFVRYTLPEACVLSLEGGERKKPPMVRHFRDAESGTLPVLDNITTLVCKSQWNLIRAKDDFQNIAAALPNLTEWHAAYAKGKSKSYLCMKQILPKLPANLTNLNLCLESDFRHEAVAPAFWGKVWTSTHFCCQLSRAVPTLEHFAYTGRVCPAFFHIAAELSDPRTSRLKSMDIIVKNVCRPSQWHTGSGITDMAFISAFEGLVIAGVMALDNLSAVELLRIRFIDLGMSPWL